MDADFSGCVDGWELLLLLPPSPRPSPASQDLAVRGVLAGEANIQGRAARGFRAEGCKLTWGTCDAFVGLCLSCLS